MLIKMTCGTYGYRDERGIVDPKDEKSFPFEVKEEEAVRLINEKMAVECEQDGYKEEPSKTKTREEELEGMGKKALEALAKEMELPYRGNRADLIERIIKHEDEIEKDDINEGEQREEPPKLEAEEPEE